MRRESRASAAILCSHEELVVEHSGLTAVRKKSVAFEDGSGDVDDLPVGPTSVVAQEMEGLLFVERSAFHQDPLCPLRDGAPPEGALERVVLGETLERDVHRALRLFEIAGMGDGGEDPEPGRLVDERAILHVEDGDDRARSLAHDRADELERFIRVVADDDEGDIGRFGGGRVIAVEARSGANDFVPKPVDTAELFAALRPWLPTTPRRSDPLIVPAQPAANRARQSQERGRGDGFDNSPINGVKILVVDDDFRNIFAMTALLERGHADVLVAESGAEAIATLERLPDVDVVLMDIMMPDMDGYDTIRAIRRIDRHKDLPIVAVTGKSASGERERCLDAGANEYVPKPIDTGELLAALAPLLPTPAQPAA